MQELVKGQLDWHKIINENFNELNEQIGGSGVAQEALALAEEAKEGLETKLDKPVVTEEVNKGFVYQEEDGTVTLKDSSIIRPDDVFKYTIIVDNGANSDPAAVEYYDDCVGFIEAKGSDLGDWGNTKLVKEYFRPCVIAREDEVPKYYLQQNNRTLKEDGSQAVLTGEDGDVMIEIKKLYGKFLPSGDKLKISLSNIKEDDTWFCFNDIGGVEKDVVYMGVYEAGTLSGAENELRSVSGVVPTVSKTRPQLRTMAIHSTNENQKGYYTLVNLYIIMLYQIMFLLMYKNRNSQLVLGYGAYNPSVTQPFTTGHTNEKTFCWGEIKTSQTVVKGINFLGIEDFYGNVWDLLDGIGSINNIYKITRDPLKYNDDCEGYEILVPSGLTGTDSSKFIVSVHGTNDAGFLPKLTNGSSSTFWCDIFWMENNKQVSSFGGSYKTSTGDIGVFAIAFNKTVDKFHEDIGSRLCRV